MANEISAQSRLSIAKNGTTATGNKTTTLSLAGSVYAAAVQNVGTTAEALTIGDASDLRYCYLANNDATQTVTLTFSAIVLSPGDACIFPPATPSITLQATANGVDVDAVYTEA